jgi:hypothetical protein
MATMTINISAEANQPPDQSGWVVINVDYNTPIALTVSNFTTETSPEYHDPEGDDFNSVKFNSLPNVGVISLSGSPISAGDEITSSQLNSGLAIYSPNNDEEGYISSATFYVSDVGSLEFNLNPNRIQFFVSDNINKAPSQVGDGSQDLTLGSTFVFTRASLTTQLNPPYEDPEGDIASKLLVEKVPIFGLLKLNGVTVVNGQEIDFTDIDSSLLVYESEEFPTNEIEGFQFKISDTGSGEFIG